MTGPAAPLDHVVVNALRDTDAPGVTWTAQGSQAATLAIPSLDLCLDCRGAG